MKPHKNYLLIATILIQFSCADKEPKKHSDNEIQNNVGKIDTAANQTFSTDPKTIAKDFNTWYQYSNNNIKLSEQFIPIDIHSNRIDKQSFLNKILNENVVALKTKIENGKPVYQLYNLVSKDADILMAIKQMAATELSHLKMEGTKFPDFNFTDLNGNKFNNENTKGKIIVLKCWFIHCVACVKEFPELNKLVEKYQDRKDMVFISLAFDKKEELTNFLKTRDFKYLTIPEMEDFMASQLSISQFPTHIIIDKDGKIKKVVNTVQELEPYLKLVAAKGE